MIDFESKIKEQIKAKKKETKRINENILFLLNVLAGHSVFGKKAKQSNDYDWRVFHSSVAYCLMLISGICDSLSKYLKENDVLGKMKESTNVLKQISSLTKVNANKSGREVDKEKIKALITGAQKLYAEEVGLKVNKLVRESLKQSLKKACKIKI